jgi:hypothetical protein
MEVWRASLNAAADVRERSGKPLCEHGEQSVELADCAGSKLPIGHLCLNAFFRKPLGI